MKKIGEILTKKIVDLKLNETDFKEVFDAIISNDADLIDIEKEKDSLKVKLDDAEKKLPRIEELETLVKSKDNEISDLKIKYIDRFENGRREEEERKKRYEDDGTAINSIEDLFEKEK